MTSATVTPSWAACASAITVEAAETFLTSMPAQFGSEERNLESAAGCISEMEILADRDGPPLDFSQMDGIAIDYAAWEAGIREFQVLAIVAAGIAPPVLESPQGCMEVMTGAPCPKG